MLPNKQNEDLFYIFITKSPNSFLVPYALHIQVYIKDKMFEKFVLESTAMKNMCVYIGISLFSPVSFKKRHSLSTLGVAPIYDLFQRFSIANGTMSFTFMTKRFRDKFAFAIEKEIRQLLDPLQEAYLEREIESKSECVVAPCDLYA